MAEIIDLVFGQHEEKREREAFSIVTENEKKTTRSEPFTEISFIKIKIQNIANFAIPYHENGLRDTEKGNHKIWIFGGNVRPLHIQLKTLSLFYNSREVEW